MTTVFYAVQVFFPFDREKIFLLCVTFPAGRNQVDSFRGSTPGQWYYMIHCKVGDIELPPAIMAFTGGNFLSPPCCMPKIPGLLFLTGNEYIVIVEISRFMYVLFVLYSFSGHNYNVKMTELFVNYSPVFSAGKYFAFVGVIAVEK